MTGAIMGDAPAPDCWLVRVMENWRRVMLKAPEGTAVPLQAYTEVAMTFLMKSDVSDDLRVPMPFSPAHHYLVHAQALHMR